MGSARRAAEGVTAAMEAHDAAQARAYMSDDFVFFDPNGRGEMNADMWLGAAQAMWAAFPDLSYKFEFLEEEGKVRNQFVGTHSNDWDLSMMGMGVIPATGIKVETGASITLGTVNADGLIERIEIVEEEPDAGIMSVLRQLGIDVG